MTVPGTAAGALSMSSTGPGKKLSSVGSCVVGCALVVSTGILLPYLMPTCVLWLPRHTDDTSKTVPMGTIVAWMPSTKAGGKHDVPAGWQLCDGKEITEKTSPWKGQNTPNLIGRFLRGGEMTNFLTFQDDQLQDHQHVDGGHTHVDAGHTHTDSGHTHTDNGHSHQYQDLALGDRGDICSGRYWQKRDSTRTTFTSHADIQPSHAKITTSRAIISTSHSNIGAVNPDTLHARTGDETRPKAVFVLWIMRIIDRTTPTRNHMGVLQIVVTRNHCILFLAQGLCTCK